MRCEYQIWTIFFLLTFLSVFGQGTGVSNHEASLRIFIDCRTSCDLSFFKQQLHYVDHVREPVLADVHILLSRYPTASGNRYEMEFIGKKSYEGQEKVVNYNAPPSSTSDEIRKGILHKLRLGLIDYLLDTPFAEEIVISVPERQESSENTEQEEDPWNFWIFEVYANGNVSMESSRRSFNWRFGTEVSHTTENWRILQNAYYSINQRIFNQDEGKITSQLQRYGIRGRVVKSISNHWSAGLFEGVSSSNFSNIDLGLSVGPAIEYSFFPYEEVTFRELTVAYFNRVYYRDYIEETLFGKTEENLWDQAIRIGLRLRRPWGSIYSSLEGRHFFHDFAKNSLELNNRLSMRVVKGLAMNVTANLEFVNDQLYLPKGEASLEDVLLQQKQLSTNYDLYVAFGLSYTFGSIYNNIINTRL